jgi:hypothetical protein
MGFPGFNETSIDAKHAMGSGSKQDGTAPSNASNLTVRIRK